MGEPERLARNLAAVLSAQGQSDWRRFVPLAEAVGGAGLDRGLPRAFLEAADRAITRR
jgi:hypothetical protein